MTHSLLQFAADLGKMEVGFGLFQHEVMEKACVMVEKEAKRVIGTYDYNWPALAEATIADRVAQGFAPDEPLLRTGEMRDSIEHRVETEGLGMKTVGLVGTDNPIAKYQELGTRTIPPRSFLGEAAMHKEEEIHELFGSSVAAHVLLHLKP
jgi:HK97 gp10 family phage protein